MAENAHVRVEIGFSSGQILSWLVTTESAEALERHLADGRSGLITLESQDGPILLVSERVVYLKRFSREPRVGFAD
ncbi:MAG: hypothetical protein RMM28_02485 [Thermoleophilia bacterium]|nr:hypothetical protein [Gaiellaceae bacterium]MDW8337990.1 hypothetical protein [Thermoleophilia bacterium]